ncbi:hypothetical protein ABZ671_01800 [Micromonospora sp. NPDC006766]
MTAPLLPLTQIRNRLILTARAALRNHQTAPPPPPPTHPPTHPRRPPRSR